MHRFIKAAGFPDDTGEAGIYRFLEKEVIQPQNLNDEMTPEPGCTVREYVRMMNRAVGIAAATITLTGRPAELLYYYPFVENDEETSGKECIIEQHTATETYSGIIDEAAQDISLMFHMTNSLEYRKLLSHGTDPMKTFRGAYVSAFANQGKVLLPLAHDTDPLTDGTGFGGDLFTGGAGNGAPGNLLTLEGPGDDDDDDDYLDDEALEEEILARLRTEDLYSLVEQSFIPWGVDCDLYCIVGEITGVEDTVNTCTGIPLWLLRIICNDVKFRLCIPKDNLLGEPLEGRRVKCSIWMHGRVKL